MVIDTSGNVFMSGTLSVAKDVVLTGADCAEHFDLAAHACCEPGTVVVIGAGGALDASTQAYDKKGAGAMTVTAGSAACGRRASSARPAAAARWQPASTQPSKPRIQEIDTGGTGRAAQLLWTAARQLPASAIATNRLDRRNS